MCLYFIPWALQMADPYVSSTSGLGIRAKNKAITFTGCRFISSIGISSFKVKRLFSG